LSLVNFYFLPLAVAQVEGPEIVQISQPLASEDDEVGVEHGGGVVGPFPGRFLTGLGLNGTPLLGAPVEHAEGVEACFVGSASSKKYNRVTLGIVVGCTVGSN
jgi:hypothetical protein